MTSFRIPASSGRPRGRHAGPRTAVAACVAHVPRVLGVAALVGASAVAANAGTASSTPLPESRTIALPPVTAPAAQPAVGLESRVALQRELRVSRASSRDAMEAAAGKPLGKPRSGQARERSGGLAKLAASAEQAAAELAQDAWQLPMTSYRLTARFGECSALWSRCHTGLDFAAPSGAPIRAIANGVITEAGWAGAYGYRTILTLADGTELWFAHQLEITVRAGQTVTAGQQIGLVGSTGNVTGPHLHLEVRPGGGDAVDPYNALAARGIAP